MRGPQESGSRRKSKGAAASPTSAKRAHVLVAQQPPHSELLRAVELSSSGEDILQSHAGLGTTKRQRRASALKAASRAHEFANTGSWPEDDDACTVPILSLTNLNPTHAGHADSAAHHSDDSAEEDVWGPRPQAPLPLLNKQMGESSRAAIGLLAMSLPEEEVKAASRTATPLGGASPEHNHEPHPPSGLGALGQTLERAAWARRLLPKDKSHQLMHLLRRAATAYSTAVEAEGPVLATARLLAAKQAVLSRHLSEALQAAGELEDYISRASSHGQGAPSRSAAAATASM